MRPGVSLEGKDVGSASKQSAHGRRMLLAEVEQGSGVVLGQLEIDSKTNEIPPFRELAKQLDLAGRLVTGDALHAQEETARCLLEESKAVYITAVKNNQPTLLRNLQEMDSVPARWSRRWTRSMAASRAGATGLRTSAPRNETTMPPCTSASRPSAPNVGGSTSRPTKPTPKSAMRSPRRAPRRPPPSNSRSCCANTGRSRTACSMCVTSTTTKPAAA